MTVAQPHQGDELSLVSMYLDSPVAGAHGISLRLGPLVDGHRKGGLSLDPNHCGLNRWGDRTGCTKMAIRTIEVVATPMRTLDPAGHHRMLYRVASSDLDREQATLIEYPAAGLWYLVYERRENGTSVVPLFPAKLFEANPAGTIAMRYGVPMREVIARGDLEEMKLEAKLVRDALEALDDEPELPTGRSVAAEHVSEVRKALGELERALAGIER